MGRGSKRKRRPGVYELRVYVGRDPMTGKPIQRSRTFRGGDRAADDALVKFIDEVRRAPAVSRGQVADLVDRYLTFVDARGHSPATMKVYRSRARRVVGALGHLELADVTPSVLDRFYESLLAEKLEKRSVLQFHTFLSGVFKQAMRWGWMSSNPAAAATAPRPGRSEVSAPSPEQVLHLLETANRRNATLACALLVAATTGARRGELCGLRWSDVDFVACELWIRRAAVRGAASVGTVVKSTKTGGERRVSIDEWTVAALRLRWEQMTAAAAEGVRLVADPFVFPAGPTGGEVTNPDVLSSFFARVRRDAKVPGVKLHHLRHFMATEAIAAGMDLRTVAGRLGHSDPSMTLRVYGHLIAARDRELADSIGRLLGPGERARGALSVSESYPSR